MASISVMVQQIEGLQGTGDLTSWEEDFVDSICETFRNNGSNTTKFTPKQVENIEKIWKKHFA